MNLLVITEFSPNASGGGPAVVRQMLKCWPTGHLFWWSCLREQDHRFGQNVQQLRCAAIPKKLYPRIKLAATKSALLEAVWSPLAVRHLKRTLRELKPDAVWVIPHNWSIPPVAEVLAPATIKYHVTVQDYADVHDNPRRFGRTRCARMAAMADRLYANAATRDATSHPIIADLQTRTGRSAAQVLHAGLEAEDFDLLDKKVSGTTGVIRIGYAGTILVEEVFALFVSAVEKIRRELPMPVELHLFGSHSYVGRPWFNRDWIRERGNLPEPELLAKLRECDWAYSPMALTDHDPRYNRFSFPTKFIRYLAAGLPVITMGHPESSVMKMAAQYQVGPSIGVGEADALASQLREALAALSPWENYGEEIVRCARSEFDAERMRRILYDCFARCAGRPESGSR